MDRPDRAYITLGDLSAKFGWKHADLIKRMEAKRLAEASEYYKNRRLLPKCYLGFVTLECVC